MACSPRLWAGSLQVLWPPHTIQCRSYVNWLIGYSKLLVDCCQSCAELATYITDAVTLNLQIMDGSIWMRHFRQYVKTPHPQVIQVIAHTGFFLVFPSFDINTIKTHARYIKHLDSRVHLNAPRRRWDLWQAFEWHSPRLRSLLMKYFPTSCTRTYLT